MHIGKSIFIPLILFLFHTFIYAQSININPYKYEIKKNIECKNGAVVSAHTLASETGVTILMQGGNAIDAAIATQLAEIGVMLLMFGVGLHFSVNTSREVILMNLNHDLIFQLVYNLINNAIRYNRDEGDITITDHFIPGESYVLFIKDSGVGIPEDELETIFDRFKKSRRTEGEGYGLGLSIVQSIAQYHGLKIAVASKAGKGATFSIIFPGNMV